MLPGAGNKKDAVSSGTSSQHATGLSICHWSGRERLQGYVPVSVAARQPSWYDTREGDNHLTSACSDGWVFCTCFCQNNIQILHPVLQVSKFTSPPYSVCSAYLNSYSILGFICSFIIKLQVMGLLSTCKVSSLSRPAGHFQNKARVAQDLTSASIRPTKFWYSIIKEAAKQLKGKVCTSFAVTVFCCFFFPHLLQRLS